MASYRQMLEDFVKENEFVQSALNFVKGHKIITATSLAAIGYGIYFFRRPKNLPPGPLGYPVIGSMGDLTNVLDSFSYYKKKYGDIFCLWQGGDRYVVVVASFDLIKEVGLSRGSEFCHRDSSFDLENVGLEDSLFNTTMDENYKGARKMIATAFRNLIAERLDTTFREEFEKFERSVEDLPEFDPNEPFRILCTNTIFDLVYGKKFALDDPELSECRKIISDGYKALMVLFMNAMIPPLFKPFLYFWKKQSQKIAKTWVDMSVKFINLRKEAMTQEKKVYCAADAFLANNRGWSMGQLGTTLALFIPDGASTTAEQMMWMVVYLLNNPQYADAIHKETLSVEGSFVTLKDKPNMPLTEAFMNEVIRCVSPADISGMNHPMKDTQLRGYTIPANVSVMPYLAGALYDEKIFPEPHAFKPERFIVDGKFSLPAAMCPFGYGLRSCIGEGVAKSQLFLLVANLVKRYKILPGSTGVPSYEKDKSSLMKIPQSFKVHLEKRK